MITTTWLHPEPFDEDRQDASFYVRADSTSTPLARLTDEDTGDVIEIRVEGHLSLSVYDTEEAARAGDGEPVIVEAGDELAELAIANDIDLASERIVWDDNAWFDLYDGQGRHLDVVTHGVDEAIAEATEVLADVRNALRERGEAPFA